MEWMYSEASLRDQMAHGHQYLLAYDGPVAVGYVSVEQQGEHLFHLQKIYVLPERQGEGVGRQLFEAAIALIKSLHPGPCAMELNVNRQNRAVTFYERMGMHKDRSGDFDIGHGFYMNDYIMRMDIWKIIIAIMAILEYLLNNFIRVSLKGCSENHEDMLITKI